MTAARMARTLLGVLLVAVLGASGCASRILGDNEAREPNTELPPDFGALAGASGPSVATQQTWDVFFSDPNLRSLIDEAIHNNQDLNIQLQEIIITQNEIAAARGEYIPRVEAGVGAGIEKVGGQTSQGVSDEAHGVPEHLPDFRFGFRASWEADVWGRLRNARKAANLRYEATLAERNFILTEIVAEIAKEYYELVALDRRLEILDKNIGLQQDALEVVKAKKEAARATELGVKRLEAEVLKNQGARFDLQQQQVVVENRINFLVGRFPQHVQRSSETFDAVQPNTIATGLPSELLANRPDVKAAELQLEAAKLDTKVAKARFYPALSLDAEVGYESFNLRHIVQTPQSLAYNLAGNLTAPLLNRAAIKADYRTANARQVQAVYAYERALLMGYTDVYNELSGIDKLSNEYDRLAQQVEALQHAIEISNVLYRSAHADYYEVLMTRRDALDAEMELVETKLMQLHALVAIYQALGGGWRRTQPEPKP